MVKRFRCMGEWFATLEGAKTHARSRIESYYADSETAVTVTELDAGDKRFMLSTPVQAESLTAAEVPARTIEVKQNYRDHHASVVMVLEYTEEAILESSHSQFLEPTMPVADSTSLDIEQGKPSPVVQGLHDPRVHINDQPNEKVYGYEDWLEENPNRAFS